MTSPNKNPKLWVSNGPLWASTSYACCRMFSAGGWALHDLLQEWESIDFSDSTYIFFSYCSSFVYLHWHCNKFQPWVQLYSDFLLVSHQMCGWSWGAPKTRQLAWFCMYFRVAYNKLKNTILTVRPLEQITTSLKPDGIGLHNCCYSRDNAVAENSAQQL